MSAVSIKFRLIKITGTTKSNMNIFCYCLDAKVVERLEGRAGDERVSRSLIFFECHDKNETHVYKA